MTERKREVLLKKASDLRKDLKGLQKELAVLTKEMMENEVSKRKLHKMQTLHTEIHIIYEKLDTVYTELKKTYQ